MAIDVDRDRAVRDGLALFVMAFRQEVDAPQRRVYSRGLQDVPAHIIEVGAERLIKQAGRRFFPTLPEWIGACADVIDDLRAAASRQAKALLEDCHDCHGTGWADAEGPNAVTECLCKKRARDLMASVVAPIQRLALPPSSDPGEAA